MKHASHFIWGPSKSFHNSCLECFYSQHGQNNSINDKILLIKKYLAKQQYYKCAICKMEFIEINKSHLDHDHNTGKIRGLLCFHCNTGLGYFKDNIDSLQNAILYITYNNEIREDILKINELNKLRIKIRKKYVRVGQ